MSVDDRRSFLGEKVCSGVYRSHHIMWHQNMPASQLGNELFPASLFDSSGSIQYRREPPWLFMRTIQSRLKLQIFQ
jgi:hypothetical protein